MIEKLKQTIRGFDDKPSMPTAIEFFNKINEIIELLNAIVVDVDGIKCVDGSKKPEPADPYAEQRKYLCKLCWFWNENYEDGVIGVLTGVFDNADRPFERNIDQTLYKHCEPVKPDDDIIYKGANNE